MAARIYVSKRFAKFFYHEKALSLERYIPQNNIFESTSEYFYMASVCRQYSIDQKIIKFLKENAVCNIVYLGSGLETSFNRIGNSSAKFYQIDLPNVIDIRQKILGKADNEVLIAGDMFTLDWVKHIDLSIPTMISVSGVYQYFKEDRVYDMIRRMKSVIPGGELVFDATNSKGLELANKYVRSTGNTDAKMYFCVDNPLWLADKTGTKLLSVDGFYKAALRSCKGLKIKTKIFMYFADKLKRTLIIHLRF